MDLERVLLGKERELGRICGCWVLRRAEGNWVGKGCLCKLFRKSEVVLVGCISEIRNNIGLGLGFDDWVLGLWKRLWISGRGVGICLGMGLWESGGG